MPNHLDLQMPNELPALEAVVQSITAHLEANGADTSAIFTANLVLEELITNIIKYGYDDKDRHIIQIRAEVKDNRFQLEVSDDGHPFNPFNQAPPKTDLPIEERQIGGLGIHFVRNMMDECHYERRGDRNIVSVNKAFLSEK